MDAFKIKSELEIAIKNVLDNYCIDPFIDVYNFDINLIAQAFKPLSISNGSNPRLEININAKGLCKDVKRS